MTRGEAWLTHVSTVLAGGTGLVYGWMRFRNARAVEAVPPILEVEEGGGEAAGS